MNKKAKFLSLIFILLFIFFLLGMKKMNKLDELRNLKKGTPYNEIIDKFGKPDLELGSGFTIIGYKFNDKVIVLHFMGGDRLLGLWEEKGEEVTIYIPLENSI